MFICSVHIDACVSGKCCYLGIASQYYIVCFRVMLGNGWFHVYVAVERGLMELRKLGIEQQLWEASRKEIDLAPLSSSTSVVNHKPYTDSEISP